MMSLTVTNEPLLEVLRRLRHALGEGPVHAKVLNPLYGQGLFAGEVCEVAGQSFRYRSLHVWIEVAERLGSVCAVHEISDHWMILKFSPLDASHSWHSQSLQSGAQEKYGVESTFSRISKFEQPSFLTAFFEALRFLRIPSGARILAVGVNHGEELNAIREFLEERTVRAAALIGIDHSESAIQRAKERYADTGMQFICADLLELERLQLGRFDLIVCINTLQSAAFDGHAVLQKWVKHHVTPRARLLLGLPNSRLVAHEVMYGAKMKNYPTSDLSLLVKDIAFYRRYLHQHQYQVRVLGKHTVFIAGRLPD